MPKTDTATKQRIRKNIMNYYGARRRAKERNLDFDLSSIDYANLTQLPCEYCGRFCATGYDRVDNTLGYSRCNVVPSCALCNRMKSDFELDVFRTHIQRMFFWQVLSDDLSDDEKAEDR